MIRSFKVKPSVVHERFGDETVIVNLDSGTYYSAQGVASIVWALIDGGASEADVLQRIKAEFSGDGAEISTATAKFLDQLIEEALVDAERVADGNAESNGGQTEGEAGQPGKVFAAPLLQKYTDMEDMLLLDPIHEVDEQGWPSAKKAPE